MQITATGPYLTARRGAAFIRGLGTELAGGDYKKGSGERGWCLWERETGRAVRGRAGGGGDRALDLVERVKLIGETV